MASEDKRQEILVRGLYESIEVGLARLTQVFREEPSAAARIFPYGITRIEIALAVEGLGSAGLEIQGPDSGPPGGPDLASNRVADAAPSPEIVSISPTEGVQGDEIDLLIVVRDPDQPSLVKLGKSDVRAEDPKWMYGTDRITVKVRIDEKAETGARQLRVGFVTGYVATYAGVFTVQAKDA
jgi:hypothetical protein